MSAQKGKQKTAPEHAKLEEQCGKMAEYMARITASARHIHSRSKEDYPITEIVTRFEDISFKLYQTSMNLALEIPSPNILTLEADNVLLAVRRTTETDEVFAKEQRNIDQHGQDTKTLMDWLSAVELRIGEIVVNAYKAREAAGEDADMSKVAGHLATLGEFVEMLTDDLKEIIDQ